MLQLSSPARSGSAPSAALHRLQIAERPPAGSRSRRQCARTAPPPRAAPTESPSTSADSAVGRASSAAPRLAHALARAARASWRAPCAAATSTCPRGSRGSRAISSCCRPSTSCKTSTARYPAGSACSACSSRARSRGSVAGASSAGSAIERVFAEIALLPRLGPRRVRQGRVDRQPIHPGRQLRVAAELLEAAIGAQEDLLRPAPRRPAARRCARSARTRAAGTSRRSACMRLALAATARLDQAPARRLCRRRPRARGPWGRTSTKAMLTPLGPTPAGPRLPCIRIEPPARAIR